MTPEGRLAALARVARLFAESVPDLGALLELVARTICAETGDACTVRMLTADRRLEPAAAHHPDPEVSAALRESVRRDVRPGELGVWKPVIEEQRRLRLVIPAGQPPPGLTEAQLAFTLKYQPRHALLAPLTARGRILGGISLSRYDDRPYEDADQAFLDDLADRAALAIDNAKLLDAARSAREAQSRAEAHLRQSQKMEAVGRLAGGIAHDFNNTLTVILSYSSMILDDLAPGDPMREDLIQVQKAGERAAGLTRQLLAFSRRQVLEPSLADLGEIVHGMETMLRRLIGEDVELAVAVATGRHPVLVDVAQIEQAILNLVLNARDAMPRGGRLTLEVGAASLDGAYVEDHLGVAPGDYAMLAVTDTGTGMDRETQARVWEPFFTTKEQGKGTGLGLSTVYGIVRQSGGHVWVYSEPGRGSTFKIYLPRYAGRPRRGSVTFAPRQLDGTEHVLLVEDEEQVRAAARDILRKHGYEVTEMGDAREALRWIEDPAQRFDLLLTDLVMPHLSGAELAERAMQARPGLPVICMSGYTDEAVVGHGVIELGVAYVQKPLTPDSLLSRVRQVLDAPRSR